MSVRSARLFVFSDFAAHADALTAYRSLANGAPRGRVAFVLRDRMLPDAERRALGERLGAVARLAGQHFLVSGDVALALTLGADGVHSSSSDPPPHVVRQRLPASAWLSRAAHDFESLEASDVAALDALVVSPVWAERKGRAALGEQALSEWLERVRTLDARCGVIALGGATAAALPRALALGADAVAVLGAVFDARERSELVRALTDLESLPEPHSGS